MDFKAICYCNFSAYLFSVCNCMPSLPGLTLTLPWSEIDAESVHKMTLCSIAIRDAN